MAEDKTFIRLPEGMKDRIAFQAVASGQPQNTLIIQFIEEGLRAAETGQPWMAEVLRYVRVYVGRRGSSAMRAKAKRVLLALVGES